MNLSSLIGECQFCVIHRQIIHENIHNFRVNNVFDVFDVFELESYRLRGD